MKKRILMLAMALVFLTSVAIAGEPSFFTDSWSMGPERFFKGGKEVPPGTLGAISGDEMARQRIARESQPPKLEVGVSGYSWAERELIEAQIEYLKNAGKIEIIQVNQGFVGAGNLHGRNGQAQRSKMSGGRKGRR